MTGEQGGLGKVLDTVIQGFGKSLYKRTAARGASLVELYAVHSLVLDLDAFHVLAADVQNTVHRGVEKGSGVVVGHGFHFSVVQQESGFHQGLAITGGAGTDDLHIFRQLFVNLFQGADGGL